MGKNSDKIQTKFRQNLDKFRTPPKLDKFSNKLDKFRTPLFTDTAAGLEAREALWSLICPHLAIFCFVAGTTVGPVEHDEKPSRSVVDEAMIERPA